MGDDIKRASIGLILLFMVGTIHRYAAFSNNATSLGQILSNNAPLEMSMISSPSESQFSEDIDRQKGRIAALKAQNQQLREEQEKMLAAVSNPATFAPPTIDSGSHLRGERKLATPQSIPQQNIPSTVPSNSLMVESEGWSGALRGSGLGELASAALAKATSSLTSQEAAPQIVPSSSTESSSNQLTGSYVSFQSARSKQFLSLDEKHWVVPSLDGTFPLASRVFKVEDVGAGWVALQCADKQMYLEMVPKTQPLAWVVRGSHGESGSLNIRQHWRLEGGRLFNRESESYVNLIGEANAVRGHGNAPNKRSGAGPEPTTLFTVSTVDTQALAGDAKKQQVVKTVEADTEKAYREAIQAFPKSNEKRVVSYGLYGSNPKYTVGAIRNAELVKVWFPGWVARFYCDNTVPANIIKTLKDLDAEIVTISDIKGGIAGMFWRFLVADDDTVDRYIIRDTDSRLNPRERFAVEVYPLSLSLSLSLSLINKQHKNNPKTPPSCFLLYSPLYLSSDFEGLDS